MSLIDLGDTRVKDNLIDLGYELGTLPAEETSQSVPADKRVLVLNGVPADAEYTVEVRAYRSVDRDIHPTGLIESAPGELPANPFRPSTKVILGKDAEVNGKRIVDVVSAVDVAKKDIADLVLTYGSTDSAATNAAAANAAKLVAEALRDQAKVSADAADAAKITAQGQAAIAAGKAAEADGSRAIAEAKAAAAKLSADDAGAAQALATAKATQADAAKLAAETAKTGAETARTAAEAAKGGAETARTNAQTAATNAAQANTDATNARDAAQSARTDAITKASEAATSATNAGNSATAAQGSASTASTKADAAGASASTANAQANIATTRAGEASISASNAATSATNASGSANSATTQAGVAATSATGARLAAAALLPSDFERKGQFWQTASSGAPGTLGPIVDTMFVNVSGVGTVWQTSNFSVLAAVGLIKPVAGRTYELEARVKVLSDNTAGGNSNTTMQFVGLRADYTEETYISNVVSGFPNSQNNRVTDTDFVVWKCRYSSASPSAYLRPRFYSNWNGGTGPSGNQTVQVAYLKVTDVTEMLAAATSASAASTSASTAATKASEAGTSASAANTSATNAATKAGEASTSASNAATSATNSQGSANTATTQAGVASTARAGAESAKADAETAKGQAQSSASAAAGSASTASTKAVEAGTSASAANTSATNAATSAGNASTFANNASTSAANAQGSANTASTQAGVSASHANTAREQAAISAPGNFPRDADKWQTGNGPTATNLLSTNVRYSVGTNSFLLNRSVSTTRYIEYNSVAVFPVTDRRRYRATIVARWATLPTKGSLTISAAVRGLTSDYTYVTNRGATTANLTEEFATYILEIDADFSGAPTVTQARFQMAFNQSAETAPDGILEMRSIEFVDVTQSRAAETSATAAANSASTASTEATKAGTSATAANTSATNAATKAGEASTSATNAATSATNAQGSANTATTQAGVASSAKTAAESAKTEAETAKGQAQSSASAAAGSASTAATKAGEAGTSASAANTSATNAATKAGEASTSATNAASSATSASGSANTATTQAGVAATQAAAARDIVTSGPILPFSPASGLDQFSNGRIGSPASMGTVAATVVVDELLGTSAHITNWANAGANMVTRGVIELVPGRIYELRTRARVISGDGSVAFNHIVIPMNADYTTTAQGIQFVNTATAVDDSVIEIVSTFGTSGARFTLATGTVYVRCGFRLNTTESGLIVRVGEVRVTDVTDRVAALNSANAAATSASTASTEAGKAGTSATAANTSATNAATSAGNASTSASNASTSATNALGSANTATTQAGVAASNKVAAEKARGDAASYASRNLVRKGVFNDGDAGRWADFGAYVTPISGLPQALSGHTQALYIRTNVDFYENTNDIESSWGNRKIQITGKVMVGGDAGFGVGVLQHGIGLNWLQPATTMHEWRSFSHVITLNENTKTITPFIRVNSNSWAAVTELRWEDVTESIKSLDSANAAAGSASTASTKASEAGTSATAANTAKTAAETAKGQAETYRNDASTSATNAAGSANTATTQAGVASSAKTAAETAKTAAETARGQAQSSATAAAGSASTASTKAGEAGTSATAANNAKTGAETAKGQAETFRNEASTSASNAAGSANTATLQAGVSSRAGNAAAAGNRSPGTAPRLWAVNQYNDFTVTNLLPDTDGGAFSYVNGVLRITNNGVHIHPVANIQIVPGRRYRVVASFKLITDGTQNQNWRTFVTAFDKNGALLGGNTIPFGYLESTTVAAGLQTLGSPEFSTSGVGGSGALPAGTVYIRPMFRASDGVTVDVHSLFVEDVESQSAASQSASAAATSASTASTKASEAGTSATAANTAKTGAETARGQAQTYRDEASTSASNASGSANTATTQAGVASTARNDAQTAAGTATTKAGEAAGSANSAANSASTATTKASEAGTSASAANTAKTAAETAKGQAESFRNDAATSASNAAGSANTATTQAGVAAQSRDKAVAAASRNLVTKNNFADGQLGQWGGAVSVVTDGSDKALRLTDRDCYEGTAFAPISGSRRLRVTARGRAPGAYPLTVGVNTILQNGSLDWSGSMIAAARTSSYATVTNDFVINANAVGYRPWVQSAGNGGAADQDVRVTSIMIEDVTDSHAAQQSASAAAGSASTASTKASEAGSSASAANTAKTGAETARGQAESFRNDASTSASNAQGSANVATTQAGVAASNKVAAEKARGDAASYASRNLVRKGVFNDGDAGSWQQSGATVININTLPQQLSGHSVALYIRTIVDYYEVGNDIESSWGNRKIQISGKVMVGGDAGFGVGVLQHGIGLNWLQPATTMHEWRSFSHVITLNENTKTITPFVRVNSNSWAALTELRWEDVTESQKSLDSANASAGSASTASTKASEAGASAAAANTSKTAAETAKGQAETYRNEASTSASNAAGSANTATTQAGVAASARDVAVVEAAKAFPGLETRFDYWGFDTQSGGRNAVGGWETQRGSGALTFPSPGNWIYMDPKGWIKSVKGKRYKAGIWIWQWGAGGGYGGNVRVYWEGFSANKTSSDYFGAHADAPEATRPFYSAIPNGDWHCYASEFEMTDAVVNHSNGYWFRPRINIDGIPANGAYVVAGWFFEDITDSTSAKGFANAASTSASTASAKADAAGSSASAANTAKTNAETARGQAESYRNEAVSARDTAGGHASTASSQAGLAATYRNEAQGARDTANNHASTAQSQAAIATGAAATATTQAQITARASGGGGNLLLNTEFDYGNMADWTIFGTYASTANNAPNADYTPRAGNNFMMYSTSPADNTFGLYCTQMPSIKGGSYLEASAYVVAHRTQVWMQIEWHSATAMIGASSPGWQSVAGGYAQTLNDYTRIVHRAQAPANAAFARILIQFRGYQASNNCYGWVHKPMLCEVINLTGDPVPYAPATIGRVTQQAGAIAAIDGRTKAYLQNSVVAGTSTARLSLYAESSPGVRASAAELVADAVYLGNNRVLEVTNGLVRVNGKVAAANVEASSLSAISANIGLLKSAESGRRTEIDNYGVRSYHPNGNLAVRMGTWY